MGCVDGGPLAVSSAYAAGMEQQYESSVLDVVIEDHIATIWLDRPDKLNAMGPAFWDDLPRIVEALGR